VTDADAPQIPGIRSADFVGFNIALLLGALNDNFFKFLLVFYISRLHGVPADPDVIAVAGVVFVVPFLALTPLAGLMADRFSKSRLLQVIKAAEIFIMLSGWIAFRMQSPTGLYATLALMAAQSALFGPAKYSILPELVRPPELSRGNAVVAVCTYLAIIAASGLAPGVVAACDGDYVHAQVVAIVLAGVGFLASLLVGRTPAAGTARRGSWFVVDDVWRTLRDLRARDYLIGAIVGSAFFSLVGAFVQANILSYGVRHMGLSQESSAYLFLVAAAGISAGSWLAGRLSGRLIEFGIVPIGVLAMAIGALVFGLAPHDIAPVAALLVLTGVGGGLFLIPLDAFIQRDAPPDRRAEAVAAASFIGWIGVLAAQGIIAGNQAIGLTPAQGFALLGALTLVTGALAVRVLPDFLTRFVVLVFTRLLCRVRVSGLSHVPESGGALIVSNHASYLDAALLIATQQRRLRFVVWRGIYDRWPLLRPFFRILNCIPISGDDPPRQLAAAIQAARRAVQEGYLVVIFPEGELTRTGHIRAFRRGFEKVVKGTGTPIIPVYLGGAWGSLGSYYRGSGIRRLPRLGRYPFTVLFGRPLPTDTPHDQVQQAVAELSCDYFAERKGRRRPLGEEALRALRRRAWRPLLADTTGRSLTGWTAAAAVCLCAARLRRLGPPGTPVGILLPPSVAGALANVGAQVAGLVPVNLNPTASAEALRSAITQSGLRVVVTSPALLARLGVQDLPAEPLDIAAILQASRIRRLRAALAALLLPARLMARRPAGFGGDSPAAILFSSGSTGTPKGIVLSHHNLFSNVESLRMVFETRDDDRLLAALPFFHSFGFMASIWHPVLSGVPVTYHVNPLDAAGIGKACREHACTLLFSTPTFLALYTRKIDPADFSRLRFVATGAERLRPAVAEAFEARFGVVPREGYGATELSPVAAFSVPDVSAGGARQSGSKPGSVGLPVPGVVMKVVDPDTGCSLPSGTPGLLLVKGPNVMLGYLNRADLTAAAIVDGWYRTGDIACIDEDGFVRITDRLARFSKLGGEMVPHGAIEEIVQQATGRAEPVVAVTAAPDDRRGERLVLFYTPAAGPVEVIQAAIAAAPLPNLWKPGPEACVPIDALPLLPTGKMDLSRLREKARAVRPIGEI
jgi:acyl-[acyl-carrier-protein]-phospholipid O-acyltransferase/long-chain-fatty-acid--[acyl-carrier-protein] ligase